MVDNFPSYQKGTNAKNRREMILIELIAKSYVATSIESKNSINGIGIGISRKSNQFKF